MTPLVPLRLPVEPVVEAVERARDRVAALVRLGLRVGPVRRQHRVEREADTNSDTSTAHAMVSANGLNHCPATPYMNATGTNTATIENVVAATASPISSVPSMRRRDVVLPHLDVPHDVLAHHDGVVDQDADREREAQQRHRVEREAERPDGDERGQHRHRQRQAGDDRRAPGVEEEEHHQHGQQRALDQRLLHVRHRAARPARPASCTISSFTPAGMRAAAAPATRARIRSLTSVVLYPLDLMTSMPTACALVVERQRARLLGAVVHLGHLAQPDRSGRSRSATTSWSKSAGPSSRPCSRMVRSSSAPLSRPTGAARFCACSACTTCGDADARGLAAPAGCSSTVISRSMPPTTLTWATPGIGAQRAGHARVGQPAQRRWPEPSPT